MASRAAAARDAIQRHARRVLKAAGQPALRRQAHRRGKHPPSDLAAHEPDLLQALSLFENDLASGLPVRDRQTVSLLARACVVPHAAWEPRQRWRALDLFESSHKQRGSSSADGVPAAATSAAAESAAPERWLCEVDGCTRVARWGDAATGYARACGEHRREDEARVDMQSVAVHAIADSLTVAGAKLERAAPLYEFLAHAATHAEDSRAHVEAAGLDSALTRFFQVCARKRLLPEAARRLRPYVDGARDRVLLNGYIRACAAAGHADEAFSAHRTGEEAGVMADRYTITALVSAAAGARQLGLAMDVVDEARRAGIPVDTDVHITSALLKACALSRAADTATEVATRAMRAGLSPNGAVLNALATALAADGRVSDVEETLARGGFARAASGRDADTAVATLLQAFVRAHDPKRAVAVFQALREDGYTPSSSGPHAALLEATAAAAWHAGSGESEAAEELESVLENALACGFEPDSRLVSAMMVSCLTLGDAPAAYAAFERGVDTLGVAPDVHVLRALLKVCVRLRGSDAPRRAETLRRAAQLAEAHGLPLRDVSDLWLKAHIVAVPRRLGDAAIDAALEAYSEGRQQMWDQTVGSRRALLELCARHDRTLEALDVLQHMHDDQIEPGMEALDELMRACQRGGDVDESTLQLWLGAAGGDKQGS